MTDRRLCRYCWAPLDDSAAFHCSDRCRRRDAVWDRQLAAAATAPPLDSEALERAGQQRLPHIEPETKGELS